jgi:hypothetical protein
MQWSTWPIGAVGTLVWSDLSCHWPVTVSAYRQNTGHLDCSSVLCPFILKDYKMWDMCSIFSLFLHACWSHPLISICGPDYKLLLWWVQILPSWTHIDCLCVISGITITLFAKSAATIVCKQWSTGKLNLPLMILSALIFIFVSVVSFMVLVCKICFKALSLSECYVHMDQHIYNFCCEWKWPLGLSGPYHNASEDDNSNQPSRSHSSGRCFGGTFAFTLATCHKF